MPADIATALVAAGSAAALAIVTYGLTKKREREADLRKERLAHYKDFVARECYELRDGKEVWRA